MTTMPKNHYQRLNLLTNASTDEIKTEYRKLALQYHPDKNIEDKDKAERKFKKIAEAYAVLSDPVKRSLYDRQLGIYSFYSSNTPHIFNAPSFTVCLPTLAVLTNNPVNPDNIKVILLGSNSANINKFMKYLDGVEKRNLSFVINPLKEQHSMNVLPASCLNDVSLILIFDRQNTSLSLIKNYLKNDTAACEVLGLHCDSSECNISDYGPLCDYEYFGSSSTEILEKTASQIISKLFIALETKIEKNIPKEILEERHTRIQSTTILLEKSSQRGEKSRRNCCG